MEMLAIPGGTFMMGSPVTEKGRYDNESPQHLVKIQPFYLGKFTVTQAQWRAVAALPQVSRDLDPDPSSFKGGNLPVEGVSWSDSQEFCARLTRKTGRTYRCCAEVHGSTFRVTAVVRIAIGIIRSTGTSVSVFELLFPRRGLFFAL